MWAELNGSAFIIKKGKRKKMKNNNLVFGVVLLFAMLASTFIFLKGLDGDIIVDENGGLVYLDTVSYLDGDGAEIVFIYDDRYLDYKFLMFDVKDEYNSYIIYYNFIHGRSDFLIISGGLLDNVIRDVDSKSLVLEYHTDITIDIYGVR